MADDTDDKTRKLDRRTVLRASGASLTAGAVFESSVNRGAADQPSTGLSDRRPDLHIVDNSDSDDSIEIRYRLVDPVAPSSGQVESNAYDVATESIETIGVQRLLKEPTQTDVSSESDADGADNTATFATVDRLSTAWTELVDGAVDELDSTPDDRSYHPFEIEVVYGDDSDTVRTVLGPDGASRGETIEVYISRDGEVIVDITV